LVIAATHAHRWAGASMVAADAVKRLK
jgi:hypothetical protein